ncbi:histidine kinase [Flavobacterium sp. ANB]|uniref:sensor histidine kinase n=1 Tax=unclassified Flavobacterium TaxID=196869 RepID=UPI0012B9DCD5|nr:MULTISPECIES: histidine kinase [unclassified Flavobacterium]MBF4517878.1 histidine kinase [Flavobacterium sp. ANB]MTD72052.1 sensor histidine kinase [Flavobacterium sp. LC2016-13]
MNFSLKNIYSGRKFFILGIVFISLTLFSLYILSNLITQITEKSNIESTKRSFIKRQEIVQQEFSRFLQIQSEIDRVIQISNPGNLSDHLKVLSTIHANDSLVKNNWFQINDNKIEFTTSKSSINLETTIKDFILKNGSKNQSNSIIQDHDNFFWRIYFKSIASNGTIVRYGFDVDLKSLQSYFSTVGRDIPNYAFVFDEKGTILYHPEIKLLKKNIFKLTNLTSADTTFINDEFFGRKIALSEYLKLDIVRYTKRLNVKNTNWYVSANSPKEIGSEDVSSVKKYASLIYLITTSILIIFFYLFTLFNKKAYREKAILSKEKNKLLLENEKINKEKALIQLQQLKEQINPHFLFNSLNSLYMLIDGDTAVARKFTLNLSKIYRYLINPPLQNIVTLQEELLFIEKYIFLQQTRFKEEFLFTINIIDDENVLAKKVPYLAFQIAIENAIKHNIASDENPLVITIDIKEDEVIITNNLNEKPSFGGESKFGHKYLESIYKYYGKNDFQAYKKDGKFTCILPLIG